MSKHKFGNLFAKLGKGKKSNTSSSNPDQADAEQPDAQAVAQKKPKNERLSSVLDASVPAAALDVLSREPKLTAKSPDGKTEYLALYLNADDSAIGGISKKRSKDEQIGAFIQYVHNGQIETYIPQDLLDNDELLILPTANTVDKMAEFQFLSRNPDLVYYIALISQDNEITITDATLSYKEVASYISDETTTANDLLQDKHVFEDKPQNLRNGGDMGNSDETSASVDAGANQDSVDDGMDGIDADDLENFAPDVKGDNLVDVAGGGGGSSSTPFDAPPDTSNQNAQDNQTDNQNVQSNQDDTQNGTQNFNDLLSQGVDDDGSTPNNPQPTQPEPPAQNEQPAQNQQTNVPANDFTDAPAGNLADGTQNASIDNGGDDFADDQGMVMSNSNNDLQFADDVGNGQDDNLADDNNLADTNFDNNTDDDFASANVDDLSDEQADQILKRKLYSNDLDLTISTEPLDVLLAKQDTKIVPFDTNRGEGFLNEQLNQISREANQELESKHNQNIKSVRQYFYDQVSQVAEAIQGAVDDTDPATEFGARKQEIESGADQKLASQQGEIEKRQAELQKDFDERAEREAKRAYEDAKQSYINRFSGELEDDKDKVASDLRTEIETEKNEALRKLQDDEKARAQQLLDQTISQILQKAMKRYHKYSRQEAKLADNWRKKQRDFMEHHRKEQIAHDEALREELKQNRQVKQITQQKDLQISDLQNKIKNQDESYQAQIKNLQDEKQNTINSITGNYETQIKALNSQITQLKNQGEIDTKQALAEQQNSHNEQVRELQSKYTTTIQNQNQQINDLQKQLKQAQQDADNLRNQNKAQSQNSDVPKYTNNPELDRAQARIKELQQELESERNRPVQQASDNDSNMMAMMQNLIMQNMMNNNKKDDTPKPDPKPAKHGNEFLIGILSVMAILGVGFGVYSATANNHQAMTNNQIQTMIAKAQSSQEKKNKAKLDKAVSDAVAKQKAKDKANAVKNKTSKKATDKTNVVKKKTPEQHTAPNQTGYTTGQDDQNSQSNSTVAQSQNDSSDQNNNQQ